MQQRALSLKREGRVIGFVPTMGFLHEGHLSLMRIARKRCDVLVVSIFVNPSQFAPNEDLDAYPRDFERDELLCRQEGVDIIFYPESGKMYAADASVWVDEELLTGVLCGASREGHFRGVCTVVAKLFNLVLPDLAVFGEKDAQQLRIIERMVRSRLIGSPSSFTIGSPSSFTNGLRHTIMSSTRLTISSVWRIVAVSGKTTLTKN